MAFDLSTAKPVKNKFDISTAKPIEQPVDDGEFSTGEMISNIPSSAAELGKNLYTAVRHPVKTGKGMASLAGGIIDKGAEELIQALPEGVVESINQANNWLADKGVPLTELPTENAKDVKFDDSGMADALGQHVMARYGSWDAFKDTLERDPVGVAADIAGLVSGAGALTGSAKTAQVGAALDPINAALKTAKLGIGKAVPKNMPAKMFERTAKFSTTMKDADRAKLVKTALENKVSPSYRGVSKLQGKIDSLNSTIDGLIFGAEESGKMIPKGAIFKHLKALRKEKGGPLIEGGADLKSIDSIAGEFNKHLVAIKADKVSPSQLQAIKQDIYKKINFDAKNLRGTPIKESTYKALGRGAKDALEDVAPSVGPANKHLGELLELQPHLQRSANRIENNNLIPLNAAVNIGVGAGAGGGAGAGVGALAALLETAKPRAALAQWLYNTKKMGAADLLKNNVPMSQARLAAIMAGRQEATDTNQ